MLQELEGFTYATALDLNMGYYPIRLDPMASEMCTIVGQILLSEIADGFYWFSRHLPSGDGKPDGIPRICTGIH